MAIKNQIDQLLKNREELDKKIEELKAAYTALGGTFDEESSPAKTEMAIQKAKENTEELLTSKAQKQKKWYVIFNGPMTGVFDDWYKVAPHLGSGITHKSYSSIEEAKEAYAESRKFSVKLKEPAPLKEKKTVLGKIPVSRFKIETAEEKEKRLRISEEEFLILYKKLAYYQDKQKAENYYPVYTEFTGFKANALEGIDPELLYEFFQAGLLDCVYFSNPAMFQNFPVGFRTAIAQYSRRFNDKEKCLRLRSTLPVFKDGIMVLEAVHIGTLIFASQPNTMTSKIVEGEFEATDIMSIYFGNRILHVLNERFESNYRLQANGRNYILLSKTMQQTEKKTVETIKSFLDRISLLDGPLKTEDDEVAQKMHDWTMDIDGHICRVCKEEKDIPAEKEEKTSEGSIKSVGSM